MRARIEFFDISCSCCSVCASVSQALRHSASFQHSNVSMGETKSSGVLKVRQSLNHNFFPVAGYKKQVLEWSRVKSGVLVDKGFVSLAMAHEYILDFVR